MGSTILSSRARSCTSYVEFEFIVQLSYRQVLSYFSLGRLGHACMGRLPGEPVRQRSWKVALRHLRRRLERHGTLV